MNTLYILDDPGKDKHFHHYTLTGLEKSGFHPDVVYCTGNIKNSRLHDLGHKAVTLGLSSAVYKNFNPVPILKIVRLIKQNKAAIVHVQRHRALIYAGLACRITGTPVIYTIRQVRLIRNATRRFAFNSITPALARIIAVSRGSREDFISRTEYPPEKIVVVPNGIDIKPYQQNIQRQEARRRFNLPQDRFIFGMAAGFRKAKDHIGLIRALRLAGDETADSIMAFAGAGAMEDAIRKEIKKHSLENRIILTGKLTPDEIPYFLKALDVFVHASFREGMPAAILEAMASGLPIIATDAEGVPDIFDTTESIGRMIPKGDITGLADAMKELNNMDTKVLKAMGDAATKRLLQGFTSTQMAQGIVEVYWEVLKEMNKSHKRAGLQSFNLNPTNKN